MGTSVAGSARPVTIRPFLVLRLVMTVNVAIVAVGELRIALDGRSAVVVLMVFGTAAGLAAWCLSLWVAKIVIADGWMQQRTVWSGWSPRLHLGLVRAVDEVGGSRRYAPSLVLTTANPRFGRWGRHVGAFVIHGRTYPLPRIYQAIVSSLDANPHVVYQGPAA